MTLNTKNYALITGASSGFGEALAHLLAQKNKPLILVARRLEKLNQIAADIKAKYPIEIITASVDVSNSEAVESFFKTLNVPVDIVINNAGLAMGRSPLEETSLEDVNKMIEVNIKGFTHIAQKSINLVKKTSGHIVNLSSIAGLESYEGGHVYCGSKAFVQKISKGLRIDLLGTGVRVTDIAPGAAETEFSNVRFKGDAKTASSVYQGFTPLNANDVAECIMFALTRPPHVCIDHLVVYPTAQASPTRVAKNQE